MIAECADQGQEEGSEPRAPQPEKKGSGAGQLLTTLTVLAFLRALPRQLRMEGAACGRQGGLPQGAGGEGWCCLDPALASALPLASPLSGFPGRGHRYSCGCIPCPPPHLLPLQQRWGSAGSVNTYVMTSVSSPQSEHQVKVIVFSDTKCMYFTTCLTAAIHFIN